MQLIEEAPGIDGNKHINGRKRSLAVDRLGLPWSLVVTGANGSDSEAGKLVIDRLAGKMPRLQVIAADHGYNVRFVGYMEAMGWRVEIAPQWRTVKARTQSGLRGRRFLWTVA